MIKKIGLWVSAAALVIMQSCSVNTETTYYKDAATSMESRLLMDQSMLTFMNMSGQTSLGSGMPDLKNLPSEWKSLYDLQKDGKIILNPKDSAPLKKLFLKVDKSRGDISGLSLKYDKLMPGEIAELLSQSKELKRLPLMDAARWNGNTLTIDTEKFNSTEFLSEIGENSGVNDPKTAPKTKSDSVAAYGRQMASGMIGMLKMFNMNYKSTLKFQKPIKTVSGKHDFVKQLDPKTVEINVNTKDLLDENHKFTNKDSKIVIVTE